MHVYRKPFCDLCARRQMQHIYRLQDVVICLCSRCRWGVAGVFLGLTLLFCALGAELRGAQ
jgi:hypothetical protein